MALQAPAIVDVRPTGASATFGTTTWLRGIGVRQVRLACGLVMFTYIFSHFFNHALGNISYAAMETWLSYHIWFWRIPVVNFVLYAAATTHAGLGLWALASALSLHGRPNYSARIGFEHPAFDRQSFRRRATRRTAIRA